MIMKKEIEMNGDYEMKEMLFERGLHDAVNKKLPVDQHLEYARNYVYKSINKLIKKAY